MDFSVADKSNPECWIYRADFIAPGQGELFLFANDAVAVKPMDYFYRNNEGTARVYLHELHGMASSPPVSAAFNPDPCGLNAAQRRKL